ncbi:hypothetical protein AB0F43_09835 [Kribbella sp. NPDC023972]|uniref:hypothetical protein n=1 Tax=Kribbella sp. NPDC023972 TaxID=3154795 RepID=UPI0033EB6C54
MSIRSVVDLPGAVRAEEAGDAARLDGEGDIVDSRGAAVPLGQVLDGDHDVESTVRHPGRTSDERLRSPPTKVVRDDP